MMPVSILSGKKEADVTEISYIRSIWCGRRDSNPHTTEVTEPKSAESANSTTPADMSGRVTCRYFILL